MRLSHLPVQCSQMLEKIFFCRDIPKSLPSGNGRIRKKYKSTELSVKKLSGETYLMYTQREKPLNRCHILPTKSFIKTDTALNPGPCSLDSQENPRLPFSRRLGPKADLEILGGKKKKKSIPRFEPKVSSPCPSPYNTSKIQFSFVFQPIFP